ncbi:MAG: DNA translocase FtsK 4TM domain-containing protein [Candidatus Paceibacterota bacterium]
MAKKKHIDQSEKKRLWKNIKDDTVHTILAIFSFLVAVLSLLASFRLADPVGSYFFDFFTTAFGVGYFLIPVVFVMLGISFLRGDERSFDTAKWIGAIVFLLAGLGLIYILPGHLGGIVGQWVAMPFVRIMSVWATALLLSALFIVSLIVLFEWRIQWADLAFWNKKDEKEAKTDDEGMDEREEAAVEEAVAAAKADETPVEESNDKKVKLAETKPAARSNTLDFSDEEERGFASSVVVPHFKPFTPPPLSLLERDRGRPETGDIKANANIIKRTLQNFGITVEMDEISIGPSVTRYALKPAEGVKLSRIVALNNDLSLALAAHPIRIEAPIPGKSLVGIEVPNTAKTTVGLATLLGSADYQESEKPLLVSLGKDIAGRAHFSNLAKAPHILVAGATGSGKSVTIHALITSLLYRNAPENLKFIMIDPKRVELTMYNKIPHLLTPVITDPKKAVLALKWAAKEMSRRYDTLEQKASRDIESYHKNILGPAMERASKREKKGAEPETLPETMPYIVIVIDELADIMQTYPRELESAIVRLAQMSRAVGIHLVISTQRPSVNVITGLIKANIPSRVALQVASQIDSRTILDQAGAEKLLGAGDMLYLGGEMSKPVRLQSAYITESEVKDVVKFLAAEYKDEIMNEISLTIPEAGSSAAFDSMSGIGNMMDSDSLDDDDDMYEPARDAVVSAGKASTSYIQRKLGVGYSRAAKLMDMLEERGVIGPANGSKPRDVIGAAPGAAGTEETAPIGLPE